jgi:hypothetical protein
MRQRWSLGHLIPWMLGLVFVVDVALRFISVDPLTFRAWEALSRYRPVGAAFEPSRHYRNARSYGDLTAMGNLPALRQYRTEVFTTDALGFRNAAHVVDAPIGAVLIGDSFAVGSGVSDDETVSAQLGRFWGCVVYNAGSEAWAVVPDQILPVLRRLHPRGPVIRLYAEDSEVPYVPTTRGRIVRRLMAELPREVRGAVGHVDGLLAVSPLRILSERLLKTLENDRVLPNSYAGNVVKGTLRNGDAMLFRATHVQNAHRDREVATDYWVWLRDELWAAGHEVVVVLVPGKYTVYRPFLVDPPPARARAGGSDYLDRLERELRAIGVPVLNLTPFLAAQAARHLEHGEYLYWLDDIHWNARGIALSVAAIHARWPLRSAPCGAPGPLLVERRDGRVLGQPPTFAIRPLSAEVH